MKKGFSLMVMEYDFADPVRLMAIEEGRKERLTR